jgi:hypothetical protein
MSNNSISSSNNVTTWKQSNAEELFLDLKTNQVTKGKDLDLIRHGFRKLSKQELAQYNSTDQIKIVNLEKTESQQQTNKPHCDSTDSTASSENNSIVEKKSFWSRISTRVSQFVNWLKALVTSKPNLNDEFKKATEKERCVLMKDTAKAMYKEAQQNANLSHNKRVEFEEAKF